MNRRDFLIAFGASAVALPATARAQGQVAASGEVDIAIVGAGAAGIAAARRAAAFGRSYALLEALDRVGGRAATDATRLGLPFDLGAHWLYGPRSNPLVPLARTNGLDVTPASRVQRLRIGSRDAGDAASEEFASALSRANRAIVTAGEQRTDTPAARALTDLGEWQATVAFRLGPGAFGKDLDEVSAADYARADERLEAAACRQGAGAILALAGLSLTVQHATPVTEIDWSGKVITLTTPRGTIKARSVVLTVSTAVLASSAIRFKPPLPTATVAACQKLTLGSLNQIGLEMAGNPLRLRDDEMVTFKAADSHTLALLGRVSGTDLAVATLGGRTSRDLEKAGEAAMAAFVADQLADHYGSDIRKSIGRSFASRWGAVPTIQGAMSVAVPGAQPMRRQLTQPLDNRLFVGGEAAHETAWGTLHGAWQSGERAADQALRAIGVSVPLPAPATPPAAPRPPAETLRRQRRQPRPSDMPAGN
jgi:monoamine oxidase